jgi:predicted acylesterase/phospholipase RssA
LALNGGGSKGAYEAGVIYGLTHNGDPKDFEWDVVEGISAGAINASAFALWEVGDEVAMTEWISDMWNDL